jgi:hypothetical protein
MIDIFSFNFDRALNNFLVLYERIEEQDSIIFVVNRNRSISIRSSLNEFKNKFSQYKEREIEEYFQFIKKGYITNRNFFDTDINELDQALTELKKATIDFLSNENIEHAGIPSLSEKFLQERTIAFFIEHATDPNMKGDNIFALWSDYINKSPEKSESGAFGETLKHLDSDSRSRQEIANHLTKIHQETSRWQFSDPKTRGPLSIILVPLLEAFVHFLSNFFTIKNSRQEEQLKEQGNVPELINKIRPDYIFGKDDIRVFDKFVSNTSKDIA